MVLFPPPFYFVFENLKLYRTYKIISSNELARHVMGTIFLVQYGCLAGSTFSMYIIYDFGMNHRQQAYILIF